MSGLLPAQHAPTLPDAAVLHDPDGQFRRNYNRMPFMFAHRLTGHPLFELPSLLALAQRMPDHRDTYWSNGKTEMTDRWERGTDGRMSLEDTINGIAENNSLVILKHTEQDPEYAPVLQEFLENVVAASGDTMRRDVVVGEVLILVSSPNRLTPYHMDAETNFLVQVTGDKTLCVFDHTDPAMVTDEERERYFAGDYNGAVYSDAKQEKSVTFDLRAGHGVHIPVFAPHWVRNGNSVSVSLSVNYELQSVLDMGDVFRMNRLLRQVGLAPNPPGKAALADRVKRASVRGLKTAKQMLRGKPAPYPVWTPRAGG